MYLATAPKSNRVYEAWGKASEAAAATPAAAVPKHIRNAPTKLMKELGYGAGYRYAHEEEGGFAAGETYLPDGMAAPGWYQPVDRGLESKIGEKLDHLRRRNREARKKG